MPFSGRSKKLMLNKKRVLFITHDTSLYGASRSLQTLIRNLRDVEVDLVIRRRFFRKNDLEQVRSFFGSNVRSIHEFHLPFDPSYIGKNASKLILKLTKMLWLKDAASIYHFIKSNDYDYIHLNSLVLHDIINSDFKFIIHIRDIFDGSNLKAIKSLEMAAGVIYIDEATEKPFRNLPLKNSIVLNNPFDMQHLSAINIEEIYTKVKIQGGKTIFSIIGKVVKIKGVDLVIKAFKQVINKDAILLVVGDGGDKHFLNYCKDLAKEDSRIEFYGEEPNIENVYLVSDYILRADPQFCIGRTIYEGLYAGCHVIMPGDEADKEKIFEIEKFSDKISVYTPGSVAAMAKVLQLKASVKITNRAFDSNVAAYINKFSNFINKSIY
ncbi:glycosyltransferase [Pontibacter sp. E15-1]|uniref:glycosyltransferase n=1 Tax=Pontibacter sp. E15-1 TaxID=2919918 RepID=UPI001F4FC7F5|nr:glycosyltransferase [Pontibacter sp. E15-1]MCJ8166403.1 glycosyltransferase [Pontibacter sp. E15-1]